jgi:three-Cys-motif partner protein
MNLEKFNPAIPEEEDGFVIEEADPNFIEKRQLIRHYLKIFSGTMKRKFNYLVYIDLFSGSGLKRLQNGQITSGSPSLAFANADPFSKYIFCEENQAQSSALRIRLNKYCRKENFAIFNGDTNSTVEKIAQYLPDSSKRHKVAALCLIDIKTLEIEFETIRLLAELGVHFLVFMDFQWNQENSFQQCIDKERERLNNFIGEPWSKFEKGIVVKGNDDFFRNLSKIYHKNIRSLGYIAQGSFHETKVEGLQLKHIFVGYYSHTVGVRKFGADSLRVVSPQASLFE